MFLSASSGYKVTALASLALLGCANAWENGEPCKKVGLKDTFVYDLENAPVQSPVIHGIYGVSLDAEVYIVDGEYHTPEQIQKYHDDGKKVVCYFSAGTWEPKRKDALHFPPECYCGPGVAYNKTTGICTGPGSETNEDYPWGEWYLDIHAGSECRDKVRALQLARIQSFKEKGCDGIDPDNTDSYTNSQNFNLTEQDALDYLYWLADTAHNMSMMIDFKNNGQLLSNNSIPTSHAQSLVDNFDFAVIEECKAQNNCAIYDPFLKAGKPEILIEYDTPGGEGDVAFSLTKCPSLQKGQHLLVYNQTILNSSLIALKCHDEL